jgi:hypothetical protein
MLKDQPSSKNKLLYSFFFFFDNLFTNVKTLLFLKENGYYRTGTIRENRISKDIPIPDKKKIASKMERGSTFSAFDKNNGIQYVRWVDNAVITMASTRYGVNPKNSVEIFTS